MLIETTGDMEVVGEAEDAADGLKQAIQTKPDVAVVDIELPGTDGIAATKKITAACPSTRASSNCTGATRTRTSP